MSSYITLTISSNVFEEIIFNLEQCWKGKDNYYEIEDLVHLIDHLEEEKSEFWAKENKEFKRWQEIERMMSEEETPSDIFLFHKIRGKLKEYMELSEQDEYHLTMELLDIIGGDDENTDNE